MSTEVLQAMAQIHAARSELRENRLSCLSSPLRQFLVRICPIRGIRIGDDLKSWDVLKTTHFIEEYVERDMPVLDIGAYASEILCILHRMGYTNLTGVDLNSKIGRMPHADKIRYVVSDFMHTPFDDGSFAAITSISVIEHGFNAPALLTELSRLLKPGGFFIASVDYWPNKISTDDIKAFNMDWCIFSKDDLIAFFKGAEKYGFHPVGDINLSASEPIISWQGKQYTFSWFVLRKII